MQREGGVRDKTEGENSSCWEPANLKKTDQKNHKKKKMCNKVQGRFAPGSLNAVDEML